MGEGMGLIGFKKLFQINQLIIKIIIKWEVKQYLIKEIMRRNIQTRL